MKNALITVSNKNNIDGISRFLLDNDFTIYSTGGTYTKINEFFPKFKDRIIKISDYTGFPEILGGRVKTLNPLIYGGILPDLNNKDHLDQLKTHNINIFSVVVVNLYPFEEQNCIENIDIGGVSLIRASSKNYEHVSILTCPSQYQSFMNEYTLNNGNISHALKREWAVNGFLHTSTYDRHIYNYLNNSLDEPLKYGMNPHQTPAFVNSNNAFSIVNGTLGYINVLDFLHGWLMAYEVFKATNKITFTSMKHTSPAGLAIGDSISEKTLDCFGLDNETKQNLSECSLAFIKSRSCDPLSSFGDFICCSSIVDSQTARLIKREVCDGIAATGYTDDALEILKSKKNGKFIIIKMNSEYYDEKVTEGWNETKSIYGVTLTQPYNNFVFNPVEYGFEPTDYDAIISYIVLKYSQSNNISMVYDGQLIGLGCGQQNRVGCVELAGNKALNWRLRHHDDTIAYFNSLSDNLKRQEKVNLVYEYISKNKENLCKNIKACNITLGSDGFFPFPDNIEVASKYGVTRILQPGGSIMDETVMKRCEELNISIKNIGSRMFYH
jgi:phosphoribosylaminoimidazolecarboxamide formyltransferase/IMP cyclohydrolase